MLTHTHTRLREIGPLNVNAFQQICFASKDIWDKTRAKFNEVVNPVNLLQRCKFSNEYYKILLLQV